MSMEAMRAVESAWPYMSRTMVHAQKRDSLVVRASLAQ
jgi:hypothetical protein